jgi:hypothetical protein
MASTAPLTEELNDMAASGLSMTFEAYLRIAPQAQHATAAAKSIAAYLDSAPTCGVRLVDVDLVDGRIVFTLAVTLGDALQIKKCDPAAVAAVTLIKGLVDTFSAYDPSFCEPPSGSTDAVAYRKPALRQADTLRPARTTLRQLVAAA